MMDANLFPMGLLYTFFIFPAIINGMIVRKPYLSGGWYPQSAEKATLFLEKAVESGRRDAPSGASAAVAPHAGWFYSGAIAARAVSALGKGAETVVIIGGHLPAGRPLLFFDEEGVETPLGTMLIDGELRASLIQELGGKADRCQDNTVEVLLPMVRYFFPRARLLALRLPAELASFEAGKRIAALGRMLKRRLVVLGSTDLTHYGVNYGFMPHGSGKDALRWVTRVNDAAFIEAVQEGDPALVLAQAEGERAACSAGAVLGAMGFARAMDASPAELLAYGTSADAEGGDIPDSFVGYAALAWF
jgi:AmmeMemoRadiSam system protein B